MQTHKNASAKHKTTRISTSHSIPAEENPFLKPKKFYSAFPPLSSLSNGFSCSNQPLVLSYPLCLERFYEKGRVACHKCVREPLTFPSKIVILHKEKLHLLLSWFTLLHAYVLYFNTHTSRVTQPIHKKAFLVHLLVSPILS